MFLTGRLIPLSSVFPSDPSSVKFPFHVHTQGTTSTSYILESFPYAFQSYYSKFDSCKRDVDRWQHGQKSAANWITLFNIPPCFLKYTAVRISNDSSQRDIGPTTTAIQLLLLFRSRDEERLAWNIRGGRASWPRRRLDVVLHEFVRTPYIIHRRHELSNPSRGRTPSPRGCLDRTWRDIC